MLLPKEGYKSRTNEYYLELLLIYEKSFYGILALAMAVNMMAGDFVKVKNGRFIRGGKPYYYVGANFWYGAILGSEGPGGDRVRLCRELDELQRLGIDNLRIFGGCGWSARC